MFVFPDFIDLPLIWAGIVALAVLLYVLLDGFDLGVGILFPFAPSDKCRDTMMNSIAPFWDGNETWLVMGGGGLMVAFPAAFAALMPAMYLPVIFMLIALIFRGVAFEFRYKADTSRYIWDIAFHFGSLAAAFAQGVILGGFVQGLDMENGEFAGGALDWLTPFAIATGIALVFGYALLGATWTIKKTEGETKAWAQKAARYALVMVMIFMAIVSLWVPFLDEAIYDRWFKLPNFWYLLPIPVATLYIAVRLVRAIKDDRDRHPFFLSILLFVMGYAGLAISLFPYVIPRSLTIWQAAGHKESLSFLLVGGVIVLPVVLAYTAYSYWVFRGKAPEKHDTGAY